MAEPFVLCGKRCDTSEVATLTVEAGRIASITPGTAGAALGGPDLWLAPGFIDLQINGYGGHDFNLGFGQAEAAEPQDLIPVFDLAARAGTALLCPTVITHSAKAMEASLRHLARTLDSDSSLAARVPGLHLEGPYLSEEDGPRGAHPREHVCDPDWNEFQRFQEAAGGRIRICTLAPERAGALPFIEKLVASGVVVALGHTAAGPETIRNAVQAGASVSTHLGNGSHATLPRHPNYIWEQLANDGLCATVIADGEHLPPAVLKCFARVKGPEGMVLVSDAVSLGGLPPGVYSGGRHEVLPSGKVVLAETPYLAGAGFLQDVCVANALRLTDFSLAQAVQCVSATPARVLGMDSRKGRLRVGYDADLTLFRVPNTGPLAIAATICAGQVAFRGAA